MAHHEILQALQRIQDGTSLLRQEVSEEVSEEELNTYGQRLRNLLNKHQEVEKMFPKSPGLSIKRFEMAVTPIYAAMILIFEKDPGLLGRFCGEGDKVYGENLSELFDRCFEILYQKEVLNMDKVNEIIEELAS